MPRLITFFTKYDKLGGEKEGISTSDDWRSSPDEESVMMGDIEGLVTLIIGVAGVLCIPVLVWVTVIAGLYHIVRDKVRETHPVQTELPQSAVANRLERNWKTPDYRQTTDYSKEANLRKCKR